MLVLCSIIDVEVVEEATTERTLRKHTLNGVTDNLIHAIRTLAELCRSIETLTSRIASIACVNLVCFLLTRENSLGCVDDDYVVSTVYVRCEAWLVLSAD